MTIQGSVRHCYVVFLLTVLFNVSILSAFSFANKSYGFIQLNAILFITVLSLHLPTFYVFSLVFVVQI